VIIVNNDPNDAIPQNLVLPDNFKIIEEGKPGSYAARNTALQFAKGEIIGFTDSDCIPDKNWIKNAVDYLTTNTSCDRVAGAIQIIQKSARPTVVEKYNQLYAFPQKWLIENGGGSVTANLFTYKYIFDKVGGFDENLMSMGDKFWGMKAQKAGFTIHYVENVIVHHPARDFIQLVKKERRHGGAVQKDPGKKRLQLFLNFAYQFRPRLSGLRFMLGKRIGVRIIDRLTIPFLRHYLLLVRAYEALRVQLGKTPNRT
jgi:glycosyltransferase involved in cell wall biosynthesis